MINFRKITEENFRSVVDMKRPENEGYVAANAISLASFCSTGEISNGEIVMKLDLEK